MSQIERTLFVIDETRVNPELVEVALQHIITDAEMQVRVHLYYHACTYCRCFGFLSYCVIRSVHGAGMAANAVRC